MNRRELLQSAVGLGIGGAELVKAAEAITSSDEIKFASSVLTPELVKKVRIYVDGSEVHRCMLADAEHGFVLIASLVETWGSVLNPNFPNGWSIDILYGKVEIKRICQ